MKPMNNWIHSVNLTTEVYYFDQLTEDKIPIIKQYPVGTIINTRDGSVYLIDDDHRLAQLLRINNTSYLIRNTTEALRARDEVSQYRNISTIVDQETHTFMIYDQFTDAVYMIRLSLLDKINLEEDINE